jgi:CcmD family protein
VSGGQYVAAAYGVVFVVVLAYVAIIAAKLQRLQREVADLVTLARRQRPEPRSAEPVSSRPATEA